LVWLAAALVAMVAAAVAALVASDGVWWESEHQRANQ
jgi:hypothetical protein